MARRTKAQIEADNKAAEEARAAEEATEESAEESEGAEEQAEEQAEEPKKEKQAEKSKQNETTEPPAQGPVPQNRKDAPMGSNAKKSDRVLATLTQDQIDRANEKAVTSVSNDIEPGIDLEGAQEPTEAVRPLKNEDTKTLKKKLQVAKSRMLNSPASLHAIRQQDSQDFQNRAKVRKRPTVAEEYNMIKDELRYRD